MKKYYRKIKIIIPELLRSSIQESLDILVRPEYDNVYKDHDSNVIASILVGVLSKFERSLSQIKSKYTIRLKYYQASALLEFLKSMSNSFDEYEKVLVMELIGSLDKQMK